MRHSLILPILAVLGWLLSADTALALDMEYYTYGGFNPIVQAFTRVALIFSDAGYQGLITVMTIMGVLAGSRRLDRPGRNRRAGHPAHLDRAGAVRCGRLPGRVRAQGQSHRL